MAYLTVVFPVGSVSPNFMQQMAQLSDSSMNLLDLTKWHRDIPSNARQLSDGSFAIKWQMLFKSELFKEKLDWLEANLS